MSDPTKRPGPLDGVRVLDFSMFLAGPYAGRLLADHGAEVIKIEPPGGETIRSAHPVVNGKSRYFAQLNAGKKCITLDLKSEEGKAAVRKLIVDSDVVLENFRPGVLDRDRLERCARYCLSPLGYTDPMLKLGARRSELENMFRQRHNGTTRLPAPPCEGRNGVFDSRLPGSVLTAADLHRERVTKWLPPYLVENRAKFASYFEFLE